MVTPHAYFTAFCVCRRTYCVPMRRLNNEEPAAWPVNVYNVNEEDLGEAAGQAEYIAIWNADPANAATGQIIGACGPFGFIIKPSGLVPPPGIVFGDDAGLGGRIHAPQFNFVFN